MTGQSEQFLLYGEKEVSVLCCVGFLKKAEETFLTVLQRVSILNAGVQNVMSGEDILRLAWWGLCM